MSDWKSPDFAESLRKSVTALENQVDSLTTAVFGTETFAKTAGTATALSARLQKGMQDQMGRQLARYNMPSREDVVAVGERLMEMDERLVKMEQMLEQLCRDQAQPAAAPGPKRTKKPAAKTTRKSAKK